MNFLFFFNSIWLGVALAMDAFSVSAANGLNEPSMSKRKMCCVAGVFAGFQTVMPLIGWVCVHTVAEAFGSFRKLIPWIALILLSFIGGKMLIDGIKSKSDGETAPAVGLRSLIVQGIATSIDALSVGLTIAALGFPLAAVESVIIGAVTFIICMGGLLIGKRFGTVLSNKASLLGGIILIAIGLEIFITGLL